MRFQFFHKRHTSKRAGFTLVEILVVVPVALLSIAALISLMVALVGDVVVARTRAAAVYELQDALDRFEADSRMSTAFLASFSQLSSPQGRDGNTAAFSAASPNYDVILNIPATTANPFTSARNLVYYANQPNACGGTMQLNRTLTVRVIYFTTDNGDGTKSLWRRTIVPSWTTTAGATNTVCTAPWNRDSCPTGSPISGTCQGIDEKILSNVTSFIPTYYNDAGAVTTDVRSAASISITINQAQQVAGESITSSSQARISHVNGTADVVPTNAPAVTVNNPSINTLNNPILTSFIWDAVPYADYYSLRYRIDGGAWVYPADQTTNTFQVTTARPLDVIDIEVTAKNDMGASPVGTLNHTKPLWTTINLLNSWSVYGLSTFGTPSYTLTSSGLVMMKGLVGDGAFLTALFNMPSGLRPSKKLMFSTLAHSNEWARVEILTDGTVNHSGGSSVASEPNPKPPVTWVSLANIMYPPSTTSLTWRTPTLQNGWTHDTGLYGQLQFAADSTGKTIMNGLVIRPATPPASYTYISDVYTGLQPAAHQIFPSSAGDRFSSVGVNSNNFTVYELGGGNWQSYTFMYYNTSSGVAWQGLTGVNGWTNYNNNFAPASYAKTSDAVVCLRGTLEGTTAVGDPTLISTLAAGYRPLQTQAFVGVGIHSPASTSIHTNARIDVQSNGQIILRATNPVLSTAITPPRITLDGICFYQEQ